MRRMRPARQDRPARAVRHLMPGQQRRPSPRAGRVRPTRPARPAGWARQAGRGASLAAAPEGRFEALRRGGLRSLGGGWPLRFRTRGLRRFRARGLRRFRSCGLRRLHGRGLRRRGGGVCGRRRPRSGLGPAALPADRVAPAARGRLGRLGARHRPRNHVGRLHHEGRGALPGRLAARAADAEFSSPGFGSHKAAWPLPRCRTCATARRPARRPSARSVRAWRPGAKR